MSFRFTVRRHGQTGFIVEDHECRWAMFYDLSRFGLLQFVGGMAGGIDSLPARKAVSDFILAEFSKDRSKQASPRGSEVIGA